MSAEPLLSILPVRRTYYALSKESNIPDSRIKEIIEKVLWNTPSAFNTQTTRVVVLLREDHAKLWNIVKDAVKPLMPADKYEATEQKLNGFQGAYGTILFLEDPKPYDALASFTIYADKFESWREQTSGMHQLLVWTALEAEGLGANVQHYNPIIDDKVKETWGLNKEWKLLAQMVIGKPIGDTPPPKDKKPLEDRLKVIG